MMDAVTYMTGISVLSDWTILQQLCSALFRRLMRMIQISTMEWKLMRLYVMGLELNDPTYKLTFTSPTAPQARSTIVVPGESSMRSGVFSLPAEAISAMAPGDEISRPFKVMPSVQPPCPQGPPHRTNLPLPSLLLYD